MALEPIPVYVFTGFLESGKTKFIREILADPDFTENEKTLLLQCEEGIEELDESAQTVLIPIEDKSELTPVLLKQLEKEHQPDRVLIEYNGMWELNDLLAAFPARWELYQIVTTVNAQTYEMYANNIGARMFEHLSTADLIVFNRCTDELKEMLYQKNVRAMNPRATIFLDDVNGQSEDYNRNMPLPFDVDAPVIDIAPADYGLWYVDAMGDPAKYEGKTVRFLAQVYVGKDVPAGSFVPGRFGMVCCADDISFLGFICRYNKTHELQVREWVGVTATITVEELPEYRGAGPVLHAIEVVPANKPAEDIVYFS